MWCGFPPPGILCPGRRCNICCAWEGPIDRISKEPKTWEKNRTKYVCIVHLPLPPSYMEMPSGHLAPKIPYRGGGAHRGGRDFFPSKLTTATKGSKKLFSRPSGGLLVGGGGGDKIFEDMCIPSFDVPFSYKNCVIRRCCFLVPAR